MSKRDLKWLLQRHPGQVLFFISILKMSISHAQAPQTPDISIAGVKLGMSMSEAQSHMKGFEFQKMDPTFIKALSGQPLEFVTASMGSSDGTRKGEYWFIETAEDKVASIEHKIILPVSEAVEYKTYRQQIVQKYGPPTREQNGQLLWNWDASGHPVPLFSGCVGNLRAVGAVDVGNRTDRLYGAVSGVAAIPLKNPCGMNLSINLNYMPQPGTNVSVAYGFDFRLTIDKPFYDQAVQYKAQQDAKQQDEIRKMQQHQGPQL